MRTFRGLRWTCVPSLIVLLLIRQEEFAKKKKKKKILCNVIFTVFGLGINLFCIVNYKFDEYVDDISLVDFLSQTIIVSCYRLHFSL